MQARTIHLGKDCHNKKRKKRRTTAEKLKGAAGDYQSLWAFGGESSLCGGTESGGIGAERAAPQIVGVQLGNSNNVGDTRDSCVPSRTIVPRFPGCSTTNLGMKWGRWPKFQWVFLQREKGQRLKKT